MKGKEFSGIIHFVDSMLDRGHSYRKIARAVIKKYVVGISHESIRKYAYYRNGIDIDKKSKENRDSYYIKVVPIRS